MFRIIRDVNASGVAVLLVEQNVAAALDIARRAYVLEEGRIAAAGTPGETGSTNAYPTGILGSMGHRVTLKPSGHGFEVAEGQSILQAGLDSGFMLPYSCRSGRLPHLPRHLLEGRVDYGAVHPTYLPDSDKAKGYALLCQARPLPDVVVEVHELAGMAGIRPRKIPAGSRKSSARRPTSPSCSCACR